MNADQKTQEQKSIFNFLPFFSQMICGEKSREDANHGPAPINNKMGNDQYCLRWNSYETNILSTFEGLLDSEALSDVTLFCEGESFKAHRLVLAACSTHFSKLFQNSALHGQLIVILDGTRHQDLQILLQFMYRGVAYLHQDRIESVLRTAEVLQVKGLSDGGVDGVPNHRNNGSGGSRVWSPPPPHSTELKKDLDTSLGRSTSPRPSGRIAVPADSPIQASMGPPMFSSTGGPAYPRPPFPGIYNTFGFGATRAESSSAKPTSSTSIPGFLPGSSKTEAPSPGARDSTQYSKFDSSRVATVERERDDMFEPNRSKDFEAGKSPSRCSDVGERDRSPGLTIRRPSSSDHFDRHSPTSRPKQLPSDSTTDKGGSPSGGRIYDDAKLDVKSERGVSPGTESRRRSFSGEFSRDNFSRLSSQSTPVSRSEILAAQDLRTNDQEERIKRESHLEKFETLRRLQAATAASLNRDQNMATIQKLELFQQTRGDFIPGGGFSVPLTAPLGIPASDLARIAIQVPDPNNVNGEPSSGTGTKLKCPFCERTYGYETNLRAHIRQRHQGIRVPCPFCHRSFTRNNTVRRHIAREHRHQVNPKMIPTKFGQTQVMPDQSFQDHLNIVTTTPQP